MPFIFNEYERVDTFKLKDINKDMKKYENIF